LDNSTSNQPSFGTVAIQEAILVSDQQVSIQAAQDCARALVSSLIASGVAGFVVAPGSRSTPLVLAVSASQAQSWVVLDERTAGFFALGRARALLAPVVVITTSGTATANLLPAVVEASYQRVPLIVMTADRPAELIDVGANQAIRQEGLYARFVRKEFNLSAAAPDEVALWAQTGADAAACSVSSPLGPVHINAPFREPFTPPHSQDLITQQHVGAGQPVVGSASGDVEALRQALSAATKPVVYAGGIDHAIPARELGFIPCVSEATSNLPGLSPAILESQTARTTLSADLVIQLGRTPLTRSAASFVESADKLLTIDPDGWIFDPNRKAAATLKVTLEDAIEVISQTDAVIHWSQLWEKASEITERVLETFCNTEELWEGSVARTVSEQNSFVFLGNSSPIRDFNRFRVRSGSNQVAANRGASGIDGLVATFAGHVSVHGHGIALLGDLSVLHDASSLLWLNEQTAGTLVIIDNDGGGIFDQLPSANLTENEAWFVTPHKGRLDQLLASLKTGVIESTSATDLRQQLSKPNPAAPMNLIRVRVSRERAMELRSDFAQSLEKAFENFV
jgi:2-succinyl-5-enolpyruvyl-6-hydroxy-3-cyclohexene-1-carboxylate synthase